LRDRSRFNLEWVQAAENKQFFFSKIVEVKDKSAPYIVPEGRGVKCTG
jgi:hypothetical protein